MSRRPSPNAAGRARADAVNHNGRLPTVVELPRRPGQSPARPAAEPRPDRTPERVPDGEVLTVSEAATFLRIGRNQLYDAIGRGEIPCRRIGRSIRLSRTALVQWLATESSQAGKGP